MSSPYLDRPLIPLAAALPRMLEEIDLELATAQPTEKWRLQQRTALIRDLLARRRHVAGYEGSPSDGLRSSVI